MSERPSPREHGRSEHLHARDRQHYLPTFKRTPVAFERGRGCTLWDVDGNMYLDALAGIAVNSLGHAHPAVTEAIARQAGTLLHVSNFFVTEPQVQLSEMLTAASGLERVFFTNSGTESFEGAVKLARKYARSQGRGGTIVSMENAFHGRTMAAIAAGKPAMQKGFGPMPEGFLTIPFNDADAVEAIVSDEIAAIVLEPVQGEGGVHVASDDYLRAVRAICDRHGIALIFDEIQCGMGRTGTLFAKEHSGVEPDIMLLAKALGNGVPVGAILCNGKVSAAIEPGDHGTTFGGNPLACAAAIAVMNEMQRPGFLKEVQRKGQLLRDGLERLKDGSEHVTAVRGLGLMLGMELTTEAAPLVAQMLQNGVVANATAGNVLRLVPPLIITDDEISQLLNVVRNSLGQIHSTP